MKKTKREKVECLACGKRYMTTKALWCNCQPSNPFKCISVVVKRLVEEGLKGLVKNTRQSLEKVEKVNVFSEDKKINVVFEAKTIRGKIYGVAPVTVTLGGAPLDSVAVRAGDERRITTPDHAPVWLSERGLKLEEAIKFVIEGLSRAGDSKTASKVIYDDETSLTAPEYLAKHGDSSFNRAVAGLLPGAEKSHDEVFSGFANPRAKSPLCSICEGSLAVDSILVVLSSTEIAHASCREGQKARCSSDLGHTAHTAYAALAQKAIRDVEIAFHARSKAATKVRQCKREPALVAARAAYKEADEAYRAASDARDKIVGRGQ